MTTTPEQPVVVTTAHRGVFFGYTSDPETANPITLTQARNCVYWSADIRGFVGLATVGPNNNCRVGPAAPRMVVRDVTAVIAATPEAVAAWERGVWT
jgi:hypothetical protein